MLRKTTAGFMLVILAMVTTTLLAQGRGPGIGMPMYDPKTELTLSGSIEEVQQTPCRGKRTGVHLLLKTQSEAVDVCVGPAGYIQQNVVSKLAFAGLYFLPCCGGRLWRFISASG